MGQRVLSLARGIVRIEVACRYPERFLNICAANNIEFWGVNVDEEGTVGAYLRERRFRNLVELSSKHGFEITRVSKSGAPSMWRKIRRRYILVAGLLLALTVTRVMALFVWDISVYGNEDVPTAKIMRALSKFGFEYGAFGPGVCSEELADKMILEIPELSWFAVNIRGSRADVLVRERIPVPDIVDVNTPAVVIAAKSGIITKMSVLEGTPLVGVGDTVEKGDMLVSGLLGSRSLKTRAVHALAEIEARTWYDMSSQMPVETIVKRYSGEEKKRHSLTILQNRINFYWNSGISWTDYDKITEERYLTLPGEITLPVKIVTETYTEYKPLSSQQIRESMELVLKANLIRRLEKAVSGGAVSAISWDVKEESCVMTVTLNAECIEQIAVSAELSESELHQAAPPAVIPE
ncbi:MAG: sporulation protein YqfD [Clostridiales bacterium]|nr:sporulation protein YqfD [Clostridiales bacterium]